jgi:ethanolamine utilization cobalamin adenosyltransferase
VGGEHLKPVPADNPRDFICEDDVREALKSGKTILVGDRTIVTPSARELGESKKVFVHAGWPR